MATSTDTDGDGGVRYANEPESVRPDWCDDLSSNITHFTGGDFEYRAFYGLYVSDDSFEDAWISTDCFCSVDGTEYANYNRPRR